MNVGTTRSGTWGYQIAGARARSVSRRPVAALSVTGPLHPAAEQRLRAGADVADVADAADAAAEIVDQQQ